MNALFHRIVDCQTPSDVHQAMAELTPQQLKSDYIGTNTPLIERCE